MSLTIMIPTLNSREHLLNRLLDVLKAEIKDYKAEHEDKIIRIRCLPDEGHANGGAHIGVKRNALVDDCKTDYCAFIDDDDTVSSDYVRQVMIGIEKGVDVISFRGIITSDGKKQETFIHKLGLKWSQQRGVYFRPPNHLNPMKTEIMRAIRFPETSWGEDKDFSDRLAESGLLKTEYFIDDYIYFYQYRNKK